MRALVTGGCGFIGSNLVHDLVRKGHTVDVVDDMSNGHLELLEGLTFRVIPAGLIDSFYMAHPPKDRDSETVHIIQGCFSHKRVLENIRNKVYSHVFHQAAIPRVSYSVEHPSHTTEVNIANTVRLFQACIGSVDRVIWASSSSVYGGAETLPTHESTKKMPKSPYAWQKDSIESIATIFCELYDIDIVCLRYFNVFGPGQYGDSPYSTAVSSWCNSLKSGLPMRSDGDGSQSRDLCYIDNVIHANMLAATSNQNRHGGFKGRCYNIACGDQTSNLEILEYLKKRYSHAVVIDAPWRPGDVMHTKADICRASEELGYEPVVKFWEGLEKTLEWWNIEDDKN